MYPNTDGLPPPRYSQTDDSPTADRPGSGQSQWQWQRRWRDFLVGWRRAAAYLIIFILFLTLLLLCLLLVSLYSLDGSPSAVSDKQGNSTTTLLFRGDCDVSTKYNFWGHLAINLIASGVLASSNFFMQVLVAPRRCDVDRAHAKGTSIEIGVQSWRNLQFVPRRNAVFWVLLAVSTIPLHLVFNSTILESRASTDFLLVMASEKFLEGAPWDPAGGALLRGGNKPPSKLTDMQRSLAEEPTRWQKMSIQACFDRYNDTSRSLSERRDVVMVLELDTNGPSSNSTGTFGWKVNGTAENSLWYYRGYRRTDYYISVYHEAVPFEDRRSVFGQDEFGVIEFDASTYTVQNNQSRYPSELRTMKAEYCMSETWTAPCRVEVENTLLLIVVVICFVKSALCLAILATARGPAPLITPGDAIESFITKPDASTVGMCGFTRHDLEDRRDYRWVPTARMWGGGGTGRKSMHAVPSSIWSFSYILIGGSLFVGLMMLGISAREQAVTDSEFGHDARNRQMKSPIMLSTSGMIVLANTPQLILSMCYFAYNGLFTRILSEFEWAKLSTAYRSLRVTRPKGPHQRSTYRLQLPYRWSLPLLLVSAVLHWLYSNSFYLTIFEGYDSEGEVSETRGLAYSSKSILISFCISISVAFAPLILGIFVQLPGKTVIAQNSSAIFSAACHCIVPPSSYDSSNEMGTSREALDDRPLLAAKSPVTSTEYKSADKSKEDALRDIALGKLKWGVVSPDAWPGRVYPQSAPGHLAFGSLGQDVHEVVDKSFYAGMD